LSDRKLKSLPPDPFRHQDSAIAPADAAHRDELRNGAKALYRALDPRRNDKDDIAGMTPDEEVMLLHVME
jgi:hypothetical protein